MIRRIILSVFFIVISSFSYATEEVYSPYSQTNFGGIGLIETPSARFSDDGEFAIGLSYQPPYNRLFAKVQFFPWMEAIVRYTEITSGAYYEGSRQTLKDKGFDLKFKLLEESDSGLNLALGFIDLGGTGDFSSEYLVANKRFKNVDLSLGLGWGRLGGVDHFNNLTSLLGSDRSSLGGYKRGGGKSGGGRLSLDRFFAGEHTSVFGGIEYFTPIENLSFKLEYDTSNHSTVLGQKIRFDDDDQGERFVLDSRVNFGVNYRIDLSERDKADLSLGYVRGNAIYANLAIHSNLNYSGTPKLRIAAEKLRNSNLPGGNSFGELNQKWQDFLMDRLIREMGNNGFVTHRVIFNDNEIAAEISQSRFQQTKQALDLASRVLANNAPKNINKITIINIDQGIETLRSSVDRNKLRSAALKGPLPEELLEFNNTGNYFEGAIIEENKYLYPNFFWEIKPHALGTLQHQEKFYFWQLEALIHTAYSFKKGLYLTTDIGINIANNYEDYSYHRPDGQLHHVRQDRRLYLTEGESGLRRMALDYLMDLHPNVKAKMSAGYLEWMYGGLGGEVLYMPTSKRWALGLDLYWVKQREFDQKFSFQDYQTVTGFISYYRDIPFYDTRLKLSAGKFLGKDKGVHIDISRRFDTGARVGGIVALTDCDSACVGEGSFNKWIYFELPMDLFFTQSTTRGKAGYAWSPLTKDAGQKVEPGGLYNLMMDANDEVDSLRQKSWSFKKIVSGFSTKPHSNNKI